MNYLSSVQIVAFWAVVTIEPAASTFWDKDSNSEDESSTFHL